MSAYLSLFKIRICSLITFSAVVGLISAKGGVSAAAVFFLSVSTMLASMGASAFNHLWDSDIDGLMRRTTGRPLAGADERRFNKKAVAGASLLVFAASILLSLLSLNRLVALHLFLGAFVYVVVYTVWLKRRSVLNIVVGGLAGSFAVLAGGASAKAELCAPPLVLALVMFFWTPSHFWSFAILEKEDYQRAGIPMLPTLVGDTRTARWVLMNTVFLVAASMLPWLLGELGAFYLATALMTGLYFIAMNIKLLRNPTKQTARKNFLASMAYLGVLFAGVIVDVMLL
jgi:protoheme IX farnesyltransferase